MLTCNGYKVLKKDISLLAVKGALTVKPYIPAVFVKPQFVQKYILYKELDDYLIVPKYYGITNFGEITDSTRNVEQTPKKFWDFTGNLRPIQHEVVNSFLLPQPHDGVISLQTGGGKTVCALFIASQLCLPTLVLVHNTFLRDQWMERIKAFLPKARTGIIQGDSIETSDRDIVVGMLQSIALKTYDPDTFKNFGLIIVDECHHIASEAFSKSIPKLTSKYMLGLSATLDRKDRLMHVIHWFLGPLLYKSNSADKLDDKVAVEYLEFEPEDPEYNDIIYNQSGVMFTSLMINKVVANHQRNLLLIQLLQDLHEEPGRQILVLTDRVEHTTTLYDLLPDEIRQTACILARNVKSEQRQEWCSTKRILIATYSMCKEGFDVETLNTLVMATPRPDVEQIVGRILRTDKTIRKIHPLILDVVDPVFRRQFQQRLSLYKSREYLITKIALENECPE